MQQFTHRQLALLVERAQRREQGAFSALYHATCDAQHYQALALLGDHQLAEDALQEVYLTLHKNIAQLKNPQAVVAYLNRTTFLVCQNYRRAQSRRSVELSCSDSFPQRPDEDVTAMPEELASRREMMDELQQALLQLSPLERQIVVLRYLQERKLEEIATLTGVSLSTVHRCLRRGKKQLAKLLRPKLPAFVPAGLVLARVWGPGRLVPGKNAARRAALATGAVALCAVTGLVTGTALRPRFENVVLDTSFARDGQLVRAWAGGSTQVVWAENSAGRHIEFTAHTDGKYSGVVTENGRWVLVAQGAGGDRARCELLIDRVDRQAPHIIEVRDEGGRLAVVLGDEGAGADLSSAFSTGPDGSRVAPILTDAATNTVYFSIFDGMRPFSVTDRAGNTGAGTVGIPDP